MKQKTPDAIDRYVGQRVRSRRQIISLSQEKFGEQLGVTFQQVQKYEKGINRIGAGRLQQAASVLGVPVSYFFDGAPGQPVAEVEAELDPAKFLGTNAEARLLAKAFSKLSGPDLRRRIVSLVQALVS